VSIDGGMSAKIIRFPACSPICADESTTIVNNTKTKSVIKKKNTVARMHVIWIATKENGIADKVQQRKPTLITVCIRH